MTFQEAKDFLTFWGLEPDPEGMLSYSITCPIEYHLMEQEAKKVGGQFFHRFIDIITKTLDGQTFINAEDWDTVEQTWEDYVLNKIQ